MPRKKVYSFGLCLSLSLFELFALEQDCGYGKFILVVAEVLLLFFLVSGYVLFEGLFFSGSWFSALDTDRL